ncbi:MAG: fumarylacetoacetate hydrolase family protein [Actinomycetospora chiangmaiensis]|nr:fumarylacetoacetate hydrolase family protein [Actinomycetospora chiangmaiensis]
MALAAADALPADWRAGLFLGCAQLTEGPSPILIAAGQVYDMAAVAPTISALVEARHFTAEGGRPIAGPDGLILLSPIDLPCVKASGVTFAISALERVIEARANGDPAAAAETRSRIEDRIGGSLRAVVPGTAEVAALKRVLMDDGLWSQYLEVATGPDAEIFTKSPVLSTVSWGSEIGIRSASTWNNPEPEIVLLVAADGTPVGATLGNDVNLRDFEGRSALLLGKAKDNNASCSIGPLVRLFDRSFTMDDVRNAEVELVVEGADGFRLDGHSAMDQISRDPLDLVRQALSEHQYPDGFVLFLGTLFAPIRDRDAPGRGFTHKIGDHVTVASPRLGRLVNRVTTSTAAPPWTVGIGALMRNLAERGLLARPATR